MRLWKETPEADEPIDETKHCHYCDALVGLYLFEHETEYGDVEGLEWFPYLTEDGIYAHGNDFVYYCEDHQLPIDRDWRIPR